MAGMKFTIRDLLWMTVVVAMALGWFCHAMNLWVGNRIRDAQIRMLHEEMDEMSKYIAKLEGKE
jgi:hypothetical protein